MPRSKNPENYPPQFFPLLERAVVEPEGIRLPFPSPKEANRIRNSLYAYINALDEQESAKALPEDMRSSPTFRQVKITVEGSALVLLNRRFSPEVQVISQVLENLGLQPASNGPSLSDVEALIAAEEASGGETTEPEPPPASQDEVLAALYGRKPKETTP